jgi:hypothetical protein
MSKRESSSLPATPSNGRFFRRRSLWWPTGLGWLAILLVLGGPIALWTFTGEKFLCRTERVPAKILVVEGWVGVEGFHAAKAEFDQHGYDLVVTSGGNSLERWSEHQWNYAVEAAEALVRFGVPASKVIAAPAASTTSGRTFESALAVRQILVEKHIAPDGVNIFSLGAHARRSRLVFAKVLGSQFHVGMISWIPANYPRGPWWASSERALDFIKETIGWWFEILLNSGRFSN